MPRQQRLCHITRLPCMNVVGVHQIFEVRQLGDGKAQRQRHKYDHGEQAANPRSLFRRVSGNGFGHNLAFNRPVSRVATMV